MVGSKFFHSQFYLFFDVYSCQTIFKKHQTVKTLTHQKKMAKRKKIEKPVSKSLKDHIPTDSQVSRVDLLFECQ